MKSLKIYIIALGIWLLSAPLAYAAMTAAEFLEHVDNVRAPGADFIFTVSAKQVGKPDAEDNIFEVRVRESVKSLVLYREPVKQRGRALLMDGPNMWIYVPGTSRSLRISPQQQLVGGVSHADVARVVFSLDYTATKAEMVQEGDRQLIRLELSSKEKNTPYRTIKLYCSSAYEPVKAEFFAVSGKLLRTAHYEDYQMVLGKMRPMTIRMVSAISKNENAVLTYSAMKIEQTPQAYYQPAYLNQLR